MGKKTILVIDDNKDFAEILGQSLSEDFGYEIIIKRNGLVAYETITSNNIDLVICDTEMPIMGGLELKSKLNNENINVPFIGRSGKEMYKKHWNDLGCIFLAKIFDDDKIYKTVEEILK